MNALTLDIPLFIRLLEVAREEIKSDEDLHKLVERVIAEGEGPLTMDNYDSIMGHPGEEDQPEVDAATFGLDDPQSLRLGNSPSCFTVDEVKDRAKTALNSATRLRAARSSRLESFIQIVADSVAKLRRQDVYRLLDVTPREAGPALARYIIENRPDLENEVQECAVDLSIEV